eukprot:TRINITY_DN82812_c0_g1_i1.p1 TRINITY_DN82812_c0_g1~~TRINITY_DN82812_c0_g1_i1.p1  ORF type:complete len:451 (-),score=27.47 TRINITY_DN82812_c0_g1_i1:214-1458(-)
MSSKVSNFSLLKAFKRPLVSFAITLCALLGVLARIPHQQVEEKQLIQFVALFRHGERTPIHRFSFENMTWTWRNGKLTINGMIHSFKTGQIFKSVLGPDLSPEDVQVYSTDFDRTVDTANSLLLGLFSKEGTVVSKNSNACIECRPAGGTRSTPACLAQCMNIKDKVPYLPTVELNKDEIIAMQQKDKCEGYSKWIGLLDQTPGYKYAQQVTYVDAIKILQQLSGNSSELCNVEGSCQSMGLHAVEEIWSNIKCAEADGQKYNKAYENIDLLRTFTPATQYLWHATYAMSQGTQLGGILLQKIIEILVSKTNEPLTDEAFKRVVLFSGHDTSVFSLMSAMSAAGEAHLPEFGARVSFSLFKIVNQFELEIRYDGVLFGVPGCLGGKCQLEDFVQAMVDRTMSIQQCKPVQEWAY